MIASEYSWLVTTERTNWSHKIRCMSLCISIIHQVIVLSIFCLTKEVVGRRNTVVLVNHNIKGPKFDDLKFKSASLILTSQNVIKVCLTRLCLDITLYTVISGMLS